MVDAAPAAWWKRLGALSGTTLAHAKEMLGDGAAP